MSSFKWLHATQNRFFGRRARKASSTRQDVSARRRVRPCLEVLEDRAVPAVFNIAANDTQGLITAMQTANTNGDPSNVINLTNSTYLLQGANNNAYGPNGLPIVANNLTIHGNGATIERLNGGGFGTPDFRLFYVGGGGLFGSGSLTMDNVTLQGGIAKGGDSNQGGGGLGAGGAIYNQGTLNLTDVTFTNNEALGGSSNVGNAGNGGGGMGVGSPKANDDGGGFGGVFNPHSGGGTGDLGGGGGGDGFSGASSPGGNATATSPGGGGGPGGFSQFGASGGIGGMGSGSVTNAVGSGDGGSFGKGGLAGYLGSGGTGTGGGGGGVGGGGGEGGFMGGSGGFGGGGGYGVDDRGYGNTNGGGSGGFGGGGGGGGETVSNSFTSVGGFGGGSGIGSIGGGGAGMGGAIFNMGADSTHPSSGTANLVNCTFTNNTALRGSSEQSGDGGANGQGLGGAIFNLDGRVSLTNDTLAANHAIQGGADVYNLAYGNDIHTGATVTASLTLNNSILASTPAAIPDLVSKTVNGTGTNTATVSGSHNLVLSSSGTIGAGVIAMTADPKLGPLQNNGGLTPTMLPQSGSPVLGAGDRSLSPTTDQRGTPRSANAPIDLGAVQVSTPPTNGGGSTSPAPTPPTLHTPWLLEIFDAILGGVETINSNATETVTDSFFGFPLLVSTYDGAGNLIGVTYFGFNITFLFF